MSDIPKFCRDDPRHILTRANLKMRLSESEYNSRIKRYIEDCKICSNDANCLAEARTNLSRDKTTYPWPNYDWDYSNYVDNNYSAEATGSDPEEGVFNNLKAGLKVAKGYIIDPNPGERSVPSGNTMNDRNGDFPVYGCKGSRSIGCEKWWKVKKNGDLGKPYNDKFFDKYDKRGVSSSSYYFKVGICNRDDIIDENECKKRGYNWVDGNCFQDRYAYMDNRGGIKPLRGLIPSMTTDMLAFNPLFIAGTFIGEDTPYMKIQKCPKVEGYENMDNGNIYIGILAGMIIVGLIIKLRKS